MKPLNEEFVGDQESLRQINLSIVLAHLRQNEPVSRAALAELTGLNPATITRLVRDLIEHGLVRETGFQSIRAGRPSILLQLDPDAGCMIGVAIEVKFGSIILTDFSAHILWRKQVSFGECEAQESILKKIARLVRQACSKAREIDRAVLGLGVSLPRLADESGNLLLFSSNMGWRDVPVKEWLEHKFDIPIYVNNRANLAALAEGYFGSARNGEYVLYVDFSTGVAAAILFNQRIVAGASDLAGEVGHMSIDLDGPRCRCGSYGCWETYVSTQAVFRRVQEAIFLGKKSRLKKVIGDGFGRLTMQLVVEAAQKGDGVALASFEETGFYLGVGLANLINTLNPQQVVLGGYVTQAREFLLPVIEKTVRARALQRSWEATDILVAAYRNDASLMGAVAAVYAQILSNPNQAFQAGRGPGQCQKVILA